jgi:hypothetical protein
MKDAKCTYVRISLVTLLHELITLGVQADLSPWPAQSPGPNPTENVWRIVKRAIAKIPIAKGVVDLQQVEDVWDRIPLCTIQTLIDSMLAAGSNRRKGRTFEVLVSLGLFIFSAGKLPLFFSFVSRRLFLRIFSLLSKGLRSVCVCASSNSWLDLGQLKSEEAVLLTLFAGSRIDIR